MEEIRFLEFKGTRIWVSSEGKIYKDDDGKPGKWINENKRFNHDGYEYVFIDNRSHFTERVHRLVAFAFIPYPDDGKKYEINHIDYDRKNNHIDNLEWVTHHQNILHSLCNKPDMTGKNNPNYGNHKLSKIYADNPEYALEKQSRPGKQNGRCVKIHLWRLDEDLGVFDYIAEAITFMLNKEGWIAKSPETLRNSVRKAMKEKRLYKNLYRFERI